MWKILVCLMVVGFVCDGVKGATGDILLSGTIQLTGGTMCLQDDGNSVADATCVEVVVIETATAGQYKIQTLAGTRSTSELILNPDADNSFGSSGSTIVFFLTENLATEAELINSDAPFEIRLSSVMTVCLTAAGKYTTAGACTPATDLWYFDKVDCKVTDCATCNADALLCDTCDANKFTNADKTACQACGTAIEGCTTCIDSTGSTVCSECEDTKTLHSAGTSCVADCTVDNCKYCDTDPATCGTCDDGYDMDGNTCEEEAATTESSGSALSTTIILLMAVVALKSLIVI